VILSAQGLCFGYGSALVLNRVNVSIGPGITAIIGPNAAGKTTLLKCLCGLLKTRGQVSLDGRELTSFTPGELSRLVSYLPQDFSARAVLTVFETVLLGRMHQLGWRVSPAVSSSVEQLLHDTGLAGLADRYIGELSGGQLQMVAIAQALAREPAVLLMDEPCSNLDLRRQFEICTLIRGLTASRRISAAMTLHDLSLAARFADTAYVLSNGSVYCTGTPASVLTEGMIATVYGVRARITHDQQGRPAVTVLDIADP
jgi:iron complex transport system ATP-binding protein